MKCDKCGAVWELEHYTNCPKCFTIPKQDSADFRAFRRQVLLAMIPAIIISEVTDGG